MRCLGIDYGEKRIGLSYGDDLGVAVPLPALINLTPAAVVERLVGVVRERRITDLVLGHPLNMDDTVGPKAREVEAVAARGLVGRAFERVLRLLLERLHRVEVFLDLGEAL